MLALLVTVGVAGCLGDDPDVLDSALDSVPRFIGNLNQTSDQRVQVVEDGPQWPRYPNDGASEKTTLEIPSFDGHLIPATVYRPFVATNETRVPVLLHSHGFTGHRALEDDYFREHVAAGFGVVSFDERGHGDAQDEPVTFMHPSAEVQDVIAVIDAVAGFDWVLMDGPGDPRLGAIGGSYGGAYQLMGAVFDDRLDAIVPEITWNNIREALAPHDAIKSGWVDLFYVAGTAEGSVVFSDDFNKGFAWALASNELPAGQVPGVVPDLVTLFNEASPSSYPGAITIPTLLVQGMGDTLFNLNQAVANYYLINATDAPVRLYTHLGGHVLNSESLFPGSSPVPVGLQGVPGASPCGRLTDLQIAWHLHYLLGIDTDLGPRFCLSLEDETAVSGDAWPLPGTEMRSFDIGTVPLPQGSALAQVPLELFTADAETIVAGIPHLTGTVTAPGPDNIAYWSLWILRTDGLWEQYVDDQAMPLRLKGPNTAALPVDMDLAGVATRLAPGDTLYLTASNWEPMYFANADRDPGVMLFDGVTLQLPVLAA